MSKYIPGAVDYIAQVQPYQPDFNFFQQVLENKQSQYKAGYDKLSNLYGTLLQSPMLRPEDIELRNKFFNQIGAEISKISGMDLSLAQNVMAASQVFQPLIDNDYIMKDMAYTKQAYSELERAEALRKCTDPKKCGDQYWEGGVRAIQYQMQDFAKSSADESLKFSAPRYTPFVNVPKKAMQFAKDMGFSTQTVTQSPDGRWIVTTKNGAPMVPGLTDAFVSAFRNDQAAADYYKTQAYLNMKDTAASNAEKYGSMEAAENAYLTEMSSKLFEQNSARANRSEQDLNVIQNKKGALENIISQEGVDLNDPIDKKIASGYGQSLLEEIIAAGAKEHYDETKDVVKPESVENIDKPALQYRVNTAMANELFMNDLAQTAYSYAMNTAEESVKEDPYALKQFSASLDHAYAMDKLRKEHEYKSAELREKSTYDLLLEGYKQGELDIKGNKKKPVIDPTTGRSINSDANTYVKISGATSGVAKIDDLQKQDQEDFSTNAAGRMEADYQLMTDVHNRLIAIANSKPGESLVLGDSGVPVVMDEKTIQAAKDQLYGPNGIFGKYKEDWKESENKDAGWIDKANAWLAYVTGFSPTSQVTKWDMKTEGGVLAPDGTLPSKAKIEANADWHNPNSEYNWFNVNKRLMNFLKNDPLGVAIVKGNTTTTELARQSSIANATYFRSLNDQRFNNQGVHRTLSNMPGALESAATTAKAYDPIWAKKFIAANYTDAEGNVMNRETFVSKYVKDYIANQGQGNLTTGIVESPYFFGPRNISMNQKLEIEAGDLYDQWTKLFVESYNQGEKAIAVFNDYKPINEGYTLSSMKGGVVQTEPLKIDGGDSAAWGDIIAKDSRDILGLTRRLINDPDKQVAVIPMTGSAIDADVYDDYKLTQDEGALKAINMIYQDIMTANNNDNRAQWSLTVHPIIGGTKGKVGYTFDLGQRFLSGNQGSDTTPGSLRGAPNTFTIIMNESDVSDLEVTKRRNRGPYSSMWNGRDPIVIDDYAQTGGYMKMSPSPYGDGGILTEGYLNYHDDDMKLRRVNFREVTPPEVTPDSLVSKWGPSIIQASELHRQVAAELKRTGNPIKNVNDLQPQ